MCVFHQMGYINLLKLLITSISEKAKINNETTDILVITSPSFQPLIEKELEMFELPLKYYILNLQSLFDSGCARLNIFKYDSINKYNKILYLDTDTLLNSDVNVLFSLKMSSNKIYALKEGTIGHEYWGSQFFDFTKHKRDLSAFTSGVLLFRNSNGMKSLFNTIQSHIVDYIHIKHNSIPVCLDQPFIVYNSVSQNKYNNKLLKKYVENNPSVVNPEKIVYHFPGGPGSYGSKFHKMTAFCEKMNEMSFVTLTNSGYIKYTLNCLESLKRIGVSSKLLHSYVIGKDGYNFLKQNGYTCSLIDNENNSNFQSFRKGNWGDITFNKFTIIYENLLKYKYVCFTDGDIVFENKDFLQYLKTNIDTYDMLVQSEGDEYEDFCSGFMYIKSNETTRSIFNPANVTPHKRPSDWGDQIYLNEIRKTVKINYKKLPLMLFPNGKYFYSNYCPSPYLIHFNWVVGNEKCSKMKQYGKWYDKIKICQHGSDGFGHQLEGMLRLISLSLSNRAEYVYDLRATKNHSTEGADSNIHRCKQKFVFAHSNHDTDILNQYLLKALDILTDISKKKSVTQSIPKNHNECKSTNNQGIRSIPNSSWSMTDKEMNPSTEGADSTLQRFKIIYNETKTFEQIIVTYDDYTNTIYNYDGVGCGRFLPPNFEDMEDVRKNLPTLRKAFVSKNPFLPKPSYDTKYNNTVCHIRLGDAVGTRILDNDAIFNFIQKLQTETQNNNNIIIHSDGDVSFLKYDNTTIYDKNTDVLQILSDFINADILIMNYSSLSIAAHILAQDSQIVFCPNVGGPTFFKRILGKCKKIGSFQTIYINKKYSWQNSYIRFLENGKMDAFGKGNYTQIDTHTFQVNFGGRIHIFVFNNNYTEFMSTRYDDNEIVKGRINKEELESEQYTGKNNCNIS